jgi:hypothetical protein
MSPVLYTVMFPPARWLSVVVEPRTNGAGRTVRSYECERSRPHASSAPETFRL